MKAYHICYHTDEDGLASAAVIYQYLKMLNKNIRFFFYKIDYTMDLKTILSETIPAEDIIYLLDYSFSNRDNLDYILKLSKKNIKVVWIDHHKTSLDTINNKDINFDDYTNLSYFIDTNYCGAYLAYVYAYFKLNNKYNVNMSSSYERFDFKINLNNIDHVPLYIEYVDSWDTWKHNLTSTTEFITGIRTENRTPRNTLASIFDYNANILNKLFSNKEEDVNIVNEYMIKYVNTMISKGNTIKSYQDIENKSMCDDYGFEFDIYNISTKYGKLHYRCFAVNSRGNSTIFGDKFAKYDIVVPFRFNGEKYIYSLYAYGDYVNCEHLAKILGTIDKLGGGGHLKAAGFQTYHQIIKSNCAIYIRNKLFRKNKYNVTIAYDKIKHS